MLYRKQIRSLWFPSLAAREGRTGQRAESGSRMSPVPKEGWGALGVGVKSNGIYILYVLTESRTQELKHSPGSPGCSSTHSDHQHTPSQVGLQAWDRRWGAWYRRNLTLIQQRAFLTASLSPPVPAPPNSPPRGTGVPGLAQSATGRHSSVIQGWVLERLYTQPFSLSGVFNAFFC